MNEELDDDLAALVEAELNELSADDLDKQGPDLDDTLDDTVDEEAVGHENDDDLFGELVDSGNDLGLSGPDCQVYLRRTPGRLLFHGHRQLKPPSIYVSS